MSDSPQPPGWYYAQGDPPDTQRYWDGSQWQGGPQPVPAGGAVGAAGGAMSTATTRNAQPGQRFIAYIIDFLLVIAVYVVGLVLAAIGGAISDSLGAILSLLTGLAALGVIAYNSVYMQGTTGQTFGKKQQGIKLISSETGDVVGIGGAVIRLLAQWAFSAITCGIGGLVDSAMILGSDNRRLTDKWINMNVVPA